MSSITSRGAGPLCQGWRLTASRFLLMVCACFLISGCAFLEKFQRDESAVHDGGGLVERRYDELSSLEENARNAAPEDLGAARTMLDEMIYYEKQGKGGELARLDRKMAETLDSIKAKSAFQEGEGDRLSDLQKENSRLRLEIEDLKKQIAGLNDRTTAQKLSSEIERKSLLNRLQVTQTALADAVSEVVRIRARIQGMASRAEASAMFAEARVLLDRMVEEAYNSQSMEDVDLAEEYLDSGKRALDENNPAGAAYLFDRVSELYNTMMKSSPRGLTVKVRSAALRSSPSESSELLGYLSQGDSANGLERREAWIRVKTPSGLVGWIRRDQVQ